ncbi:hypothetical protein BKP45_12950 [Anaerobacillus alkalidiazotrophicus]|uniref:Uncharacterized protein n=1 Tax=Anaerobacillus alkalidiazotrophicus TaxID=472963 RepID=A0A1S2M190_9BACI|nr:hypothetical protein [Anaerobacillus alkalidiazotrophicus]OIJ18471.1 hypothetical protein BKP45_18665 [Anaerobacillus alkalidiazotrophicus]OIJ19950.1 hypothetical protein BKP45_12950 [Anaerobacillus alkalidiazotrophicus]
MGKKTCWVVIIVSIIINVIMLQWTVEAFLGREYDVLFIYNIISLISAAAAIFAYFQWRKLEYNSK